MTQIASTMLICTTFNSTLRPLPKEHVSFFLKKPIPTFDHFMAKTELKQTDWDLFQLTSISLRTYRAQMVLRKHFHFRKKIAEIEISWNTLVYTSYMVPHNFFADRSWWLLNLRKFVKYIVTLQKTKGID